MSRSFKPDEWAVKLSGQNERVNSEAAFVGGLFEKTGFQVLLEAASQVRKCLCQGGSIESAVQVRNMDAAVASPNPGMTQSYELLTAITSQQEGMHRHLCFVLLMCSSSIGAVKDGV